MSRTRVLLTLMVLALCGTLFRSAAAAEDVLKVVPHDVLGAVVVSDPAGTVGKWSEAAAKLDMPAPDFAAMLKQQFGAIEGIDRRGSAAIAAVPADGPSGPTMVAFVPVTDYGKLLQSVAAEKASETISKATVAGRAVLIAQHGAFALVTEAGGEAALNKTIAARRSLGDDMTALKERLVGVDVYAVAAPAGIKMAQQQLLAGLAAAKAAMEQQGEAAQQAVVGLQMYESMFQNMDREITHAVAAARVEDGGTVRVTLSAAFTADGLLARLGSAPKTPPVDLLEDLPLGEFLFAGGGKLPLDWSTTLAELSKNVMKMYFQDAKLSDAQLDEITKASAESAKGMHSMSMMMGLVPPDEPLYANTVLVLKVDDARTYMDAYVRAMEQMNEVMKGLEKPPLGYAVERIRVGGKDGFRIEMQLKGMIADPAVPNMNAMFEKMFGAADSMSIYLAARDEHTVVGTYISLRRLEELLKQGSGQASLSRDPQVTKTLALLPPNADGIGLWSPSATFKFAAQMIGAIEPQAATMIPAFPESPPLGVATGMTAQRLDIDVVLPAELLRAIAAFARQIQEPQQLN
ncbi:MAG: hypothetical protein KJ000_04870 [Pirellulaceae bacterium]|nr:hypothetical protein [Pirellulaceae bacterium]